MLEMEEWFMLRDLYRQGLSISQIARQTSHDRKTVRTYVKSEELPGSKERAKKGSKLDAFKDYIVNRLKEGPFTASRLFKEMQEMGFIGKYTIVKDFVRQVRQEQGVQAVYRYETKPGVQAQVDWSEFGKVENTIGFVRRDFFLGRIFASLQDMNAQAISWLNKVNSCEHGTTHEIPQERLKSEGLKPIDGVPEYLIFLEETRKISKDCFISYLGNKYSVPYRYAGREATLQISDNKLRVFIGDEQVCEHEVLTGSGRTVMNKEHFKGLLGEIWKENKAARNRPQQPLLKFESIEVEKRSLSVYEAFSEGMSHE